MIVKIQKRADPYARIDNRVLNDSRLSFRAVGVLAYLLSKPNDWVVKQEELVARMQEGRDAIRNVFRELSRCGYAKLEMAGGKHWTIYETPCPEKPSMSSTGFQSLSSPEKPSPENPLKLKIRHYKQKNISTQTKEETNGRNGDSLFNQLEESVRLQEHKKLMLAKAARAKPKDREELVTYCVEVGLAQDDGEWLWDKWLGNSFTNNKAAIADWRAVVRQWKRMGTIFPSQKNKPKPRRDILL